MSTLAILSPRGVQSVSDEQTMLDIVCKAWKVECTQTQKASTTSFANVDGVLYRGKEAVAVYEAKCRYTWSADYKTLLITNDKIEKGKNASAIMAVPFIVLLYIVNDKRVYWWKVTDNRGIVQFDYDKRVTQTQATCNGGVANRENAFLPLSLAKLIKA
jgi:hypothetical protein